MKRLFCVKHQSGHVVVDNDGNIEYFDNKEEAKKVRDSLGGPPKGFYVSRGPDHMGPHGIRIARMRLQPKHTPFD